MQKKLRFFKLVIFSLIFFLASTTQAANLTCQYGNGDKYSVKDGSWLGQMDLHILDVVFKATNDVMEKLESKKLFFAGEHGGEYRIRKGSQKVQVKVYISGEDRMGGGRSSRVIKKEGETMFAHYGSCEVTF